MRILLSNLNPSWGGGEMWFFNAARELARRGHNVRVVVQPDSALEKRLIAAQADVRLVHEGTNPFADELPEVMVCNSRKKDVRHLYDHEGRPDTGLVLRKGIDRPIKDRMYRRKEINALCHILTNSDSTTKMVQDSLPWFPGERITRIYNPVPFEPLPWQAGDGETLRIATVSRLVDQKGLDTLLDALTTVKRPWTLELAGRGKNREALEQQAKKLGIDDRCGFLGLIEDVRPVYARADVIAIPSRYEGFCYTAVEAQLAGVPVIATRISSLPEVVPSAEFVPVDDAAALARAIEQVEVGERPEIRRWARETFALEPIYDLVEQTLLRAADEGPCGEARKRR